MIDPPERVQVHSSVLFQVDDDGEPFTAEIIATEDNEGVGGFFTEYVRADLVDAMLEARKDNE